MSTKIDFRNRKRKHFKSEREGERMGKYGRGKESEERKKFVTKSQKARADISDGN